MLAFLFISSPNKLVQAEGSTKAQRTSEQLWPGGKIKDVEFKTELTGVSRTNNKRSIAAGETYHHFQAQPSLPPLTPGPTSPLLTKPPKEHENLRPLPHPLGPKDWGRP